MSHIREVPAAWRNFLSLEDTPTEYTALAGQFVRVNAGNNGVEFTDDVLNKSGGTMTGTLTLNTNSPSADLEAASKGYVDSVAQGLDFKESVVAATPIGAPNPESQEDAHTGPNDVLTAFASTDAAGSDIGVTPISPGSVVFTATIGAAPYEVSDDGAGNLSGTGPSGAITGAVNYLTGAWNISFNASDPPDDTTDITVDYSSVTSDIVLSGEQTIDGVALTTGDRVLVKGQGGSGPHPDNGIYVVAAGAWARAEDADEDDEVTSGMFCFVEQGTTNGDTGWVLTTEDPITVDTTPMQFTQFSGAGTYTAGEGLSLDGSEFSVNWEGTVGQIKDLGASSIGSSSLVARSDHVHAHGDQLGGTLHAVAVASVSAGFMSGADKQKLDDLDPNAEPNQDAYGYFTDGTVTTAAEAEQDTFKFREGTYIDLVLTSNDATHGDNLVVDVNWSVLLEAIQDNFGTAFVVNSDTLTWTYNDGTPSLSADVNVDTTTIEIDAGNNWIQVKDGVFAPAVHSHVPGDITGFDEAAQDAVGTILTDTNSIDFTYDDVGNTISASVLHDTMLEITAAGLRVVDNTYAPWSHVGSNGVAQHAVATGSLAGFMSAADWTKLDGIEAGAQVNQDAFASFNINTGTSIIAADAESDVVFFNEANVVSITGNPGTDTITIGLTPGVNGQVLYTTGGVPVWGNLPAVIDEFTELTDTPSSYAGAANYRVKVNGTPDALVFVDDSFLTLNDTPASYATFGSKFVKVNAGATALEFVDAGVVPVTANANETLYWNGSAWVASGNIYNDHANSEVGINTQSPNSTLHVNGTYAGKRVTITASKDLGSDAEGNSQYILVNNSSAVTVTLPSASGVEGREYYIKKISATGGAAGKVTIEGAGAETIDGDLNVELKNQWEAYMFVSDGTNWYVF